MKSRFFRSLRLIEIDGALTAFMRWKKFSLAAYQIVSRLKHAGVAPATVIDVGANVGQFAVAVANLMPGATVYPIEPDMRTAERLRRNVGPDIARNVRVTAVGERNGTVQFNVNRDSQVSSILSLGEDRLASFPGSTVAETIDVPLATLDSMFAAGSVRGPILLKIDVQGYEDRVIAGASELLKQVRWVMMEVSFARLYQGELSFDAVVSMMKAEGFRFIRPLNFHVSDVTGEIIEMDALFGNEALVPAE
jgi:FkbM family methyltransferase